MCVSRTNKQSSCLLSTFSFRYSFFLCLTPLFTSRSLSQTTSICIKYYIISLALWLQHCDNMLVRSVNTLASIVYLHIKWNKQTARKKKSACLFVSYALCRGAFRLFAVLNAAADSTRHIYLQTHKIRDWESVENSGLRIDDNNNGWLDGFYAKIVGIAGNNHCFRLKCIRCKKKKTADAAQYSLHKE